MQLSELLKSAGIEVLLKDLPHIHNLTAHWPRHLGIYPAWVFRTTEGDPVYFEVVTTSKEVTLALTRLEPEQLYHLLSCLRYQIHHEVVEGKSEEMLTLSLNGKTFVASEVRSHIYAKVVIHIS